MSDNGKIVWPRGTLAQIPTVALQRSLLYSQSFVGRSLHEISHLQDWLTLHGTEEDKHYGGDGKVHCILIKLN